MTQFVRGDIVRLSAAGRKQFEGRPHLSNPDRGVVVMAYKTVPSIVVKREGRAPQDFDPSFWDLARRPATALAETA